MSYNKGNITATVNSSPSNKFIELKNNVPAIVEDLGNQQIMDGTNVWINEKLYKGLVTQYIEMNHDTSDFDNMSNGFYFEAGAGWFKYDASTFSLAKFLVDNLNLFRGVSDITQGRKFGYIVTANQLTNYGNTIPTYTSQGLSDGSETLFESVKYLIYKNTSNNDLTLTDSNGNAIQAPDSDGNVANIVFKANTFYAVYFVYYQGASIFLAPVRPSDSNVTFNTFQGFLIETNTFYTYKQEVGGSNYEIWNVNEVGSSSSGGSSAPEFTNVSPSNGFRVGNSNVTYTLNQDLSEGTITWTATAGTDPISHSINLVTDTKHTTGTHTVTGPTGTSLVDGVTYTVKLNGKNSNDNVATEVEITGIVYDTTAPTLSSVTIVGSESSRPRYVKATETVTLSFTSNETIETPTVKFVCNDDSGVSQNHTNATVSNPLNNDWTAVWTVPANRAGLVTFEITTVDKANPANTSTHTTLTTPAETVTVEIPSNELEKVHDLITILSGGGNHNYTMTLPNSISDISNSFSPILKNKVPGTHYTAKLGEIANINADFATISGVTYNDFTNYNNWLANVPENSGSSIPVIKLTVSNPYDSSAATQDYYIIVNRPNASGHKTSLATDLLRDSGGNAISLPSGNITPAAQDGAWTENEKRQQAAYSANQLLTIDFTNAAAVTAVKTALKNALAPPANDALIDVKNSASKIRNNIVALFPDNEDVTDMLKDSFPTLPQYNSAQRPIFVKKSSSTPILPETGKALYVALSPGESQEFGFSKNNHKFKLTKMGDYKYKGAWIETGQSSESYTVPSDILGTTTVKCGLGHLITTSLFNDNGIQSSAGHPLPFKLNVNGEVIFIGSAVVAGDDGTGTTTAAGFVSTADINVLTTGLSGISEETGRGDLKMKKITDSTVLAKAQALINAETDATNKLLLRANILRSILDHADMATSNSTSTSIKMSKTSLGLDAELGSAVTDVVAFKANQTVKLSDLESTEGFYAPLINDNETFKIDYGSGKTAEFVRQTVTNVVQYSLTVNGNLTVYKKTGATNLTIDNSNYSVSGYLLAGDKIELGGRLITIGSIIDGGESITLEYANVTWTNVYDPNTTSFEDNITAANPTVPLQTYNKDITLNGNVITIGNMKYVMFGNDTTINFSN